MLDAQPAIAEKNMLLSDSTLRMIRLQYDACHVTYLAVQQAEAQQLVAVQLIPLLEQNIAVLENALSVLTGKVPDAVKRSALTAASAFSAPLLAGVPSALLSRRPDVKNYELALVEREKTVIQFRGAVLSALGEVSDALVKIEKLQQQQEI